TIHLSGGRDKMQGIGKSERVIASGPKLPLLEENPITFLRDPKADGIRSRRAASVRLFDWWSSQEVDACVGFRAFVVSYLVSIILGVDANDESCAASLSKEKRVVHCLNMVDSKVLWTDSNEEHSTRLWEIFFKARYTSVSSYLWLPKEVQPCLHPQVHLVLPIQFDSWSRDPNSSHSANDTSCFLAAPAIAGHGILGPTTQDPSLSPGHVTIHHLDHLESELCLLMGRPTV
ncbi:12243_t:CDS:2, partial [Acaulospora colombiana]